MANAGWAIGGLAAAGALALGTSTARHRLLAAGAASFLACGATETPSPSTTPSSRSACPLDHPCDRRTARPRSLLLVLNNVMVVALQVPLARIGTTTMAAHALLLPLSAAFAAGGIAMALSATGGATTATLLLTASAAAFTLAEMLHATVSRELSVALAPDTAQGAYLGVHGLARSAQRSAGPLTVTAAMATGSAGWTALRRRHRSDLPFPAQPGPRAPHPSPIVSAAGYCE